VAIKGKKELDIAKLGTPEAKQNEVQAGCATKDLAGRRASQGGAKAQAAPKPEAELEFRAVRPAPRRLLPYSLLSKSGRVGRSAKAAMPRSRRRPPGAAMGGDRPDGEARPDGVARPDGDARAVEAAARTAGAVSAALREKLKPEAAAWPLRWPGRTNRRKPRNFGGLHAQAHADGGGKQKAASRSRSIKL